MHYTKDEIINIFSVMAEEGMSLRAWLHPVLRNTFEDITVPRQALQRITIRAERFKRLGKKRVILNPNDIPPENILFLPLEDQLIWEWKYRWALREQRKASFWEANSFYMEQEVIDMAKNAGLSITETKAVPASVEKHISSASILYSSSTPGGKRGCNTHSYAGFLRGEEKYRSTVVHKYRYTVYYVHGRGHRRLDLCADNLKMMEIALLALDFRSYTISKISRRKNEESYKGVIGDGSSICCAAVPYNTAFTGKASGDKTDDAGAEKNTTESGSSGGFGEELYSGSTCQEEDLKWEDLFM